MYLDAGTARQRVRVYLTPDNSPAYSGNADLGTTVTISRLIGSSSGMIVPEAAHVRSRFRVCPSVGSQGALTGASKCSDSVPSGVEVAMNRNDRNNRDLMVAIPT